MYRAGYIGLERLERMTKEEYLVKVENLYKWFPVRRSIIEAIIKGEKIYVKAVDGISFAIRRGEIFVLAGESGSGKTTTGKVLVGLEEPTRGRIFYDGMDISRIKLSDWKKIGLRRKIQMIFQDPYEGLNPRQKIVDIIAEPLIVNRVVSSKREAEEKVLKILEEVKLTPPEEFAYRYPHQLSGGQRQRVSVARAMVLEPEFVVADEPVSMVDASIRASILDLLIYFREKGVTYLYITHDLATARYVGDNIAIMYLGKIVERGPVEKVVSEPQHPYTRALVSSIPVPDPKYAKEKKRLELRGEIPTAINPPRGCRLHPRCPFAMDICSKSEPPEVDIGGGHSVSCWLYSRS